MEATSVAAKIVRMIFFFMSSSPCFHPRLRISQQRSSQLFRHASRITGRNEAPDVDTSRVVLWIRQGACIVLIYQKPDVGRGAGG